MSGTASADRTGHETGETLPLGYLRVVRGDPAPEELAALTAVIAAASATTAGRGHALVTGAWAASTRPRPRTPRAGPGAWAASARG